ncbi:MAG: ABC transporter ATP-binding protein [Acidimicrobiia bacterium]|nr:ABC transporter ATP-binding protein [Acidimicrobiia bacterium]
MTALLAIRELAYRRDDREILSGLSLHLARGERVALLGANGVGKTTLLHLLAGLLEPAAGERVLGDRSEPASAAPAPSRIGLLFQNPDDQLFGPTVLDDVAISLRNDGVPVAAARWRAAAGLQRLGIHGLADRPIHALSAGERRMVALAGVLVMEPAVLLLDEPTLGLDAVAEDALLSAVDDAVSRGAGAIMATHDVDLVFGWANRVVLLAGGRIAASGPPDERMATLASTHASLRRPWVLDVTRALIDTGVLPDGERPRSGADLATAVRRAATRRVRETAMVMP